MQAPKSSTPDFCLEGKSVLVTGASRGIGRGVAVALGKMRAEVGITYTGTSPQSKDNAAAVAKEVEAAGGKAWISSLDVADEEQITATMDAFIKHYGKIDGLVNNAGLTVDQLTMRYKTSDWDRVMDVNVRGTFLMSKAALRPMMKNGGGSIVNMSSVVALMGNPGQAAYCASKAAILGLTKSLAREVGSRKIRINSIAPGFIETDMTHNLNEEQKQAFIAQVPLQSWGTVEDIAWGTLYLLSPFSAYVTGQTLSINGGLYM